ncbi:MAG: hypothetical protein ACRDLU_02600 [Gaiellaceae bacterium]
MITAALTWPEVSVNPAIAAAEIVLSVLVWSIFRTGQNAIWSGSRPARVSLPSRT